METILEKELIRACGILFGDGVDMGREFLFYIQPSGVKSAYRKKALETHPDRHAHRPVGGNGPEGFIQTSWAYKRLLAFIKARDNISSPYSAAASRPRPKKRPRQGEHREPPRRRGYYYSGAVPRRRLLIGQYLFYSGEISWEALIKAIAWQRSQRPSLGEIAKQWGWLTEFEIRCIIRKRRLGEHVGEALVRHNLLSAVQLNVILHHQRKMQKPFGEFFVQNDYLSRGRLSRILGEFGKHNFRPTRRPRR